MNHAVLLYFIACGQTVINSTVECLIHFGRNGIVNTNTDKILF